MNISQSTDSISKAEPGTGIMPAHSQPSLAEVLLLACLTCALFLLVIAFFSSYPLLVDKFGDSQAYMEVASAIRHWDFRGLPLKQFWGLPYVMVGASLLAHLSDRTCLLVVSLFSSFVTVVLAHRLWGGWVAGFFAVLNFDWVQRSLLGGSEPLFAALLFGAFLAARDKRWLWATVLASSATVVRPVGIFALIGIGVTLLWQRNFTKLALAILIGLGVGVLYLAPFVLIERDPFVTVRGYQQMDWDKGWVVSLPFQAILKGTLHASKPWTNLLLTYGWIVFVLIGGIAMPAVRSFRQYARAHPVEMIFAGSYVVFLYTYNSSAWAGLEFPRFAIPIVPFVLLSLKRWIPWSRTLLWGVGTVSPLLAAASALGIKNVLGMLHL